MYTLDVYAGFVVYLVTSILVYVSIYRIVSEAIIPTNWPRWPVVVLASTTWWTLMFILAGNMRPILGEAAIFSIYALQVPSVLMGIWLTSKEK